MKRILDSASGGPSPNEKIHIVMLASVLVTAIFGEDKAQDPD